jgi:hypothetical protein
MPQRSSAGPAQTFFECTPDVAAAQSPGRSQCRAWPAAALYRFVTAGA